MVLHIADVFVYNRELDFLDFTHEESWSKWMNSPWDEQFTQKCSFHQLGENSLLNRKLIIFSIRKYHVYLYLSYLCWYFPFSASFCFFSRPPMAPLRILDVAGLISPFWAQDQVAEISPAKPLWNCWSVFQLWFCQFGSVSMGYLHAIWWIGP